MSLDNPRCKAFCQKIEDAVWWLIAVAMLAVWALHMWLLVAS